MKDSKKNKTYNPEITKDDKAILGDISGNLRQDSGDDSTLKNRQKDVDFTRKELDIPGRELPKDTTKKNLKDEENQLYSLGSEHNENLERDS